MGPEAISSIRAAAAPLGDAVATLDAVASRDLPRVLGRDHAIQQRASQLARARADAQRAADLLADISEPGFAQARAGVTRLVDALAVPEQIGAWAKRPALAPATDEALTAARASSWFLTRTADGLDAAARGEARRFLADTVHEHTESTRALRWEMARIVGSAARDELGAARLAWLPDPAELVPRGRFDTFPGANAEYRFWNALRETRVSPEHYAWDDWIQHPGGRPIPARVVRERFDAHVAANVGGTPRTPDWLARLDDHEPVHFDEVDAMELDLLATQTQRSHVEEKLILQLGSRWRLQGEIDRGDVLWQAAHRLPEELRPQIPQAVLDEHTNAMAALRLHTETRARERVAAGESPWVVALEAMTDQSPYRSGRTGTTVARAVLPRQAADPAHQPLVDELHRLLDRNAARIEGRLRDGYNTHVDYAEHGRAIELADTMRTLEHPPVEHASTASAETLAW
jgi:hypothetical protein